MGQRCRGCILESHRINFCPTVVAVAIIEMKDKEEAAGNRHQDKTGTFTASAHAVTAPDDEPCRYKDQSGQGGICLTGRFTNDGDNDAAKE